MPSPKYHTPDPDLVTALCRYCDGHGFRRVLEVGPGNHPFPRATRSIGWEKRDEPLPRQGVYYRRDLISDDIGDVFDQPTETMPNFPAVQFAYCRHVIEDLYNPVPLLEALKRCPAGYVECPSPAAELCQGVEEFSNGMDAPWRGYMHHCWFVWVDDGKLILTPKYTLAQHVARNTSQINTVLATQQFWNVGLLWGPGEQAERFDYQILLHERDYVMQDRYMTILNHALLLAEDQQKQLYHRLETCPHKPPIPVLSTGDDDPPIPKEVHENTATTPKNPENQPRGQFVPSANAKPNVPQNEGLEFDPMQHHNPPEDETAVQELAKDAYQKALLGDKGGNEDEYHGPPIAVEIGSWAGATTRILAQAGFRVFAVDHWLGNRQPGDHLTNIPEHFPPDVACRTFCRNMDDELFISVYPLVGSSAFWASVWSEYLPIDFLYIDASHEFQDVLADIQAWTPHVRQGGIIAGHDMGIFEGVEAAVRKTGCYLNEGRSVWWRTKA